VTVLRIVANLPSSNPNEVAGFYADLFGLSVLMDGGFIVTLGGKATTPVQLSLASEGGSGTPLPAISVEVDDFDAVLQRVKELHCEIIYGPISEPWGVRRIYLRDPAGTLINILTHN
jgi:catechol 2,3-dioxygenase-like lactoylglutathione lyase family enzyme